MICSHSTISWKFITHHNYEVIAYDFGIIPLSKLYTLSALTQIIPRKTAIVFFDAMRRLNRHEISI